LWSYVAADSGHATAPGQLTWKQVCDWHLPPAADADLYVLLGGSQVDTSPGPPTYNRWFRDTGVNACYLPVATARPAQTLRWLTELGLRGASVTMPLKREIVDLLDVADASVESAGAVNTLRVERGRLLGCNTDGEGALRALERAGGPFNGKQCVILGAGGAAAAIAASLRDRGARVTLMSRSRQRADSLAERLGVAATDLNDWGDTPIEVLVNATPVGAGPDDPSPVPRPDLLRGAVVLDTVLRSDTRLLQEAQTQAAAAVVDGYSMWRQQGSLQLRFWLGRHVEADDLMGAS
jgi:shikimate dehydrogenase